VKVPDEAPQPVHGSDSSFAGPGGSLPWELQSTADNLQAGDRSPTNEKAAEPTICGLRRRSFWLLLVVVLVVIAASVGGGIVGGIAAGRNNRTSNLGASNSSSSSSSSSSGSTPTPTTSATKTGTATTTSELTGPSFLNNQTVPDPSQAFQAFRDFNYLGNATPVIRSLGFYNIGFAANSYVWLPNDTSCCVTFCANTTYSGGWWCDQRYQPNASGPFARVWIGCGVDAHQEHSCSS